MEKEISYQINAEIISKICSNLYSFSYTDEEPGENVLVLTIENLKITVEMELELNKNDDGLLDACTIKSKIKQEKKR